MSQKKIEIIDCVKQGQPSGCKCISAQPFGCVRKIELYCPAHRPPPFSQRVGAGIGVLIVGLLVGKYGEDVDSSVRLKVTAAMRAMLSGKLTVSVQLKNLN